MDKAKLDHYRHQLEEKKRQLHASVVRSEEDGRAAQEADTAQDIVDRASGSYQKELLFARSNSDRHFLQMVEHALALLDEGSYGECEHCGEAINERRLDAVPWARLCIHCQEKSERGELTMESVGN